jgi:hypothetical protein
VGLVCGGVGGFMAGRISATPGSGVQMLGGVLKGPPEGEEQVAASLTADQLWGEYRDNMAAADVKYQGKMVELSGVPSKVEKDEGGRYYLAAACDERLVPRNRGGPREMSIEEYHKHALEGAFGSKYIPAVFLYIDERDVQRLVGLGGGQTVTVRGRCLGAKKDAATVPDYLVVVEGCTFAEQK